MSQTADTSFDQLFQPNQVSDPAPAPAAAPVATNPDAPFLKAGSTVYKTAEDAAKGIEEKDRVITTLRSQFQERFGVDPLKDPLPPVARPDSKVPADYLNNPDKYFQDIVEAARSGDPARYRDTQAQFIGQLVAPYVQTIGQYAKTYATTEVAKEFPDFPSIQASEAWKAALDRVPTLKQAISVAESDPRGASQLKDLYSVAYLATRGLKSGESAKIAPQTQTASTPPVGSQALPAPQTSGAPSGLDMGSKASRQAFIAAFEAAGKDRVPGIL